VSIIGEHDNPAEMAVYHASLTHIAGEHCEFLSIAPPIDRQDMAAAVNRLLPQQKIPVTIE
jgi:hypothetical protein